jgi:hypothetical protein
MCRLLARYLLQCLLHSRSHYQLSDYYISCRIALKYAAVLFSVPYAPLAAIPPNELPPQYLLYCLPYCLLGPPHLTTCHTARGTSFSTVLPNMLDCLATVCCPVYINGSVSIIVRARLSITCLLSRSLLNQSLHYPRLL